MVDHLCSWVHASIDYEPVNFLLCTGDGREAGGVELQEITGGIELWSPFDEINTFFLCMLDPPDHARPPVTLKINHLLSFAWT